RRNFCFGFTRSVLSMLLVPQKAASAAGSEAGMDCGTALAKEARLSPYREALRRRVLARPRALAPADEGRVGEKSGSQFGFARKPLKSLDSRKKEAWNSLPMALDFLPNDLDFPSPGFGNPSTDLVEYSPLTPLPLAFIELRAAGEAPLRREGGARRLRCVNAIVGERRDRCSSALLLDQRAGRIRELAERLVALHRLEDFVEVPLALRFRRRLHLHDVHVVFEQ